MSTIPIRRVLGLAFAITYLSVGHASSGSIQSIRCSPVNMTMTITEDGRTHKCESIWSEDESQSF